MFSVEVLFVFFVLFVVVVCLIASVRILREYERAVVFTLGRFERVKGPGLVLLFPSFRRWCGWTCAFRSLKSPARTSSPTTMFR